MLSMIRDITWGSFFLVLIATGMVACSEPVDEGRFSADEKRSELRRRSIDGEMELERVVVVPDEEVQPIAEHVDSASAEEVLSLLDSYLAAGDDEMALDYMLELEDQGGEVAVEGLGMVIDHAQDEDLRLDAIASLSMMEEEDTSAPLLRALDDSSDEVQIAALEVMADSEMLNLLPALRLRESRANGEEVAEALADAIAELEYLKEMDQGD